MKLKSYKRLPADEIKFLRAYLHERSENEIDDYDTDPNSWTTEELLDRSMEIWEEYDCADNPREQYFLRLMQCYTRAEGYRAKPYPFLEPGTYNQLGSLLELLLVEPSDYMYETWRLAVQVEKDLKPNWRHYDAFKKITDHGRYLLSGLPGKTFHFQEQVAAALARKQYAEAMKVVSGV